jgi:hypothetical protein
VRAILRATAKRPEHRWPSAGGFVAALEAGLEARSPAERADPPTMALPPPPPTVVSAGRAVAAATTAPSTSVTRPARAEPPPRPAPARGLGTRAIVGLGGAGLLVLAGRGPVRSPRSGTRARRASGPRDRPA